MNHRLLISIAAASAVAVSTCAANTTLKCGCVARALGNEEVVGCNGGDGWEASIASARPGADSYIINVVDRSATKLLNTPKDFQKGTRMASGKFEWRAGRMVESVPVFVPRCHVSSSAYDKIFRLVRAGEECEITMVCEDEFPFHCRLVAVDFPKAGKRFSDDGKSGKVVEKTVR